jgi:hypothetical protein
MARGWARLAKGFVEQDPNVETIMSLDDILSAGDNDRVQRAHRLRQLQGMMSARCDELRDAAVSEIKRVLCTFPDFGKPGSISTGLPPPLTDDSATLSFGLTVRTTGSKIEAMVTGTVHMRIQGDALIAEREPLYIVVQRNDLMVPKWDRSEFHSISGERDGTSYRIDEAAFDAAVKSAVARLAH